MLYVKPADNTSCPDTPCHKLSYYVQNPHSQSLYLRSNTTLHFLPGVHTFDHETLVVVRRIENFALVGTWNQSFVWCTKPAGYFFSEVVGLSIQGLVFVDCGIDIAPLNNQLNTADYLPLRATFCFNLVADLNISQVAVINGTGHGLLALSMMGNISIYHSILRSNKGTPKYSGGNAVFLIGENCLRMNHQSMFFTVESSLIESGSATLHDVFTSSPGLHIYIDSCFDVTVRINNSLFWGNGLEDINVPMYRMGGNMYLLLSHDSVNSSSYSILIENSIFAGGKSSIGGGLSIGTNSRMCPSDATGIHPDTVYIYNSTFSYNIALVSGGGIYCHFDLISCHATHVLMRKVVLQNNLIAAPPNDQNGTGGNLGICFSSSDVTNLIKIDDSFINNGHAFAGFGGGLYITVTDFLNTVPKHPASQRDGLIVQISNTTFTNNTAKHGGGISALISDHGHGILQVVNCTFEENSGELAMAIYSYLDSFTGSDFKLSFENTHFMDHAIISSPFNPSVVFILANKHIEFFNCKFNNNVATAILAISSHLFFVGKISFWNNTGENGGALSLCTNSIIFLIPNTYVYFHNNHARNAGGAIYVQQECASFGTYCFFQPVLPFSALLSLLPVANISLHFDNNTAGRAGDALYGGSIDECTLSMLSTQSIILSIQSFAQELDSLNTQSASSLIDYANTVTRSETKYQLSPKVFQLLFNVDNQSGLSPISSDPLGVCFCSDEQINCTSKWHHVAPVFPGGTFTLDVVIVGQRNGVVPGVVLASVNTTLNSFTSSLGPLENSQPVGKKCAHLSYTVFSTEPSVNMSLTVEDSLLSVTFTPPVVHIPLKPCPLGFTRLNTSWKCDCSPLLESRNYTCNITDQTIHRKAPQWIGYYGGEFSTSNHNISTNESTGGILVHSHCPYDYCKPEHLHIKLTSPDTQCAFNHSGIMCGACKEGLSLVLGTSKCKQCSNSFLVLLIPFSIAGVVLVFLLTVLNLTVSEGTLNGLIFYANVVHSNRATFFPPGCSNVAAVFIAWLNLDLGIETCFFSGMDAYSRTWIQFVFPLYIWIIVITIIVSAHYSTRAGRLFRKNSVKVLATLFRLSYAKIQRTTIAALSFTLLTYPDGSNQAVWLQDPNIGYLKGKHIPLFLAGLGVLLFLSLPYTLLLLFIRYLRAHGHIRIFGWITRMQPLFDAYTGPYRDKYCFWTGLHLLFLNLLFLIFAVNMLGDPALNLLAIGSASLLLLVIAVGLQGIYKKWPLDVLEASFIFNLGVTSYATLYANLSQTNMLPAVAYVSTSMTFTIFVGIVVYHACLQVYSSRMWRNLRNQHRWHNAVQVVPEACEEGNGGGNTVDNHQELRPLVLLFNKLREPLLEYADN